MGSKVHHEKRGVVLNSKLQDAYDIGMDQVSNDTRLTTKGSDLLARQRGMQHLNRRQHSQVNMPTEIDLSQAALS